MDMISHDHLWKIQRYTAIMALTMNLTAILINLFMPGNPGQRIVNIGVIALITTVLTASLLIDRKVMRYFQTGIFLIVGIFTILFDTKGRYLGDILFITGVLLAYAYRILSTYSYKTIVIVIITMTMLRLLSGLVIHANALTTDIAVTLFSLSLILFLITLLKNELIWYVKESRKNDIYIQAGMNITGFAHGMDLGTAINTVKTIKRKIENRDYGKALHFAENLDRYLTLKNALKETILFSANQSRTTVKQNVDIQKNLEAILETTVLNKEVFERITIARNFRTEKLIISAVPFEIHFILQNIITNALEAMLRVPGNHILLITTFRQKKKASVIISDTGPGFAPADIAVPGKHTISHSAKGNTGGFGLIYTDFLVKQNNILMEMHNKKEGGAEVKLTFTVKGETDV